MVFAAASPRVLAVLGPTNTGKTYLAIERMLGHASGMIGFPLRLLARENYDRIVRLKGVSRVALVTGEEKIIPPNARYFVCTVESMPLDRPVDFLAVDEIQLCGDRERGHVFTHRLLHARGGDETMFLGAETVRPLIRQLVPDAEFITRPRFSSLTYAGPRKLTRLPPRSAVVAFAASDVYRLAEMIRRQRGGTAVVLGALSPRTRNAQVGMYQAGEVDYLVATDAIGMGLNMDVDHVAFASFTKFDGRKRRRAAPWTVIASWSSTSPAAAAASVRIRMKNTWPSGWPQCWPAATNASPAEFSTTSSDISMNTTLRRISTPVTPIPMAASASPRSGACSRTQAMTISTPKARYSITARTIRPGDRAPQAASTRAVASSRSKAAAISYRPPARVRRCAARHGRLDARRPPRTSG